MRGTRSPLLRRSSLALGTSLVVTLGLVGGVPGTPTPAADAAVCTHPVWSTNRDDMYGSGRWFVANNLWNAGDNVSQTLYVCSLRSWKVRAYVRGTGDLSVKSYPNVHRDFHNWSTGHEPRLSAFRRVWTHWAARTPGRGIYDAAYDLWINGVGDPANELMIWTDNRGQVPAGRRVASTRFAGMRWRVWKTSDNKYVAFVPRHRLTHGRMNLMKPMRYLIRHRWLRRSSTLGQVDFGFEIVHTRNQPVWFQTTAFGVRAVRR